MLGRPSLHVLVVEDDTLLRWSLVESLRRQGHTVLEAGSASTARDALSGAPAPIDVVFLDYRLPDSNDLQLLEDVRPFDLHDVDTLVRNAHRPARPQ